MRSVLDFGAVGDGVADDSAAIQHAVDADVNHLFFPPGDYLLSKTVALNLAEHGRISLSGSDGTAKIIMAGEGPAFFLLGTHDSTADPGGFEPGVWQRERMATFSGLEIEGRHEAADGIRVEGAMQTTFEGVLLRELRHGIHLTKRARNVIVSHCHIYHNRGVGILLDHVNLHQIIISDSHISYNAQSGIKLLNGEIRNIQITGNDIEYNYDKAAGADAAPSAEIWIETTHEKATMREATISSNTIQARYSPGGSNILVKGRAADDPTKAGMIAITGNLIGSQEVNVRLDAVQSVTLTGNVIYSGHQRNLLVTNSRSVVVSANNFDHNPGYLPKELATGVTFRNSRDCILTGCTVRDAYAGTHTVTTPATIERKGLVEILNCERMTVSGCQVLDAAADGIHIANGNHVNVSACTVLDSRAEKMMANAIAWVGSGKGNVMSGCTVNGDVAKGDGVEVEG
jgi:hypothetical protein